MNRLAIGLSVLAAFGMACGGGDDEGGGGGDETTARACEVSSNCDAGQICEDGFCVDFTGCTPDSCADGQFCDEDFQCKDVSYKCELEGCECSIVNSAGQLEATGTPNLVVAGGASTEVVAILSTSGTVLPGAEYTLAASGDGLSVDGTTLSAASGAASTGTVTASFGTFATCEATVTNLGDAPAGSVRVYAYDDLTNQPIAGVAVVFDGDNDGVDDGGGAVTDDNGIAVSGDLSSFTSLNITGFKNGYNVISFAGVATSTTDVGMSMSARSAEPETGGFTGLMDFTEYERKYLGGEASAIRAGVVAGSLPLEAILNLNLDLIIGEISDADCEATPTPPGCYEINIPGLVETTTALPGGVVAGLARSDIKAHFDSVAVPGRRYAWSLGVELEISDLTDVINLVVPLFSDCSCDATDSCDPGDGGVGECDCDQDCGLNIDVGALFDDIVPLLSQFATGVKGNLSLDAAQQSVWYDYITPEYADRSSSELFPLLDDGTGGYGQLMLREAWTNFVALDVPALPQDPFSGNQMEAMLALTGIQSAGSGFVPLGLGLGLDCTTDNCLDRETDSSGYDGVVNGGLMCFYNEDPAENRCVQSILDQTNEGQLADGKLGLFRTKPFGGLEGKVNKDRTLLVALPLTEFLDGSDTIRLTALAHNATVASNSFAGRSFPGAAAQPESMAGRTYAPTSGAHDVHWVVFASEGQSDGLSTRWNVYVKDGASFTAPSLPETFVGEDSFAPMIMNCEGEGTSCIDVTHISVGLPSTSSFDDLVANNGSAASSLFDVMESMSAVNSSLLVTED